MSLFCFYCFYCSLCLCDKWDSDQSDQDLVVQFNLSSGLHDKVFFNTLNTMCKIYAPKKINKITKILCWSHSRYEIIYMNKEVARLRTWNFSPYHSSSAFLMNLKNPPLADHGHKSSIIISYYLKDTLSQNNLESN